MVHDDLCKLLRESLPEIIKKDVWLHFLERNKLPKTVATVCEKIVCDDPEQQLFNLLTANIALSKQVVMGEFLTLDMLSVDSEETLIIAGFKFLNELRGGIQNLEEYRTYYRTYFLPFLRLLTLRPGDLARLYHILLPEETLFLLSQLRDNVPLLTFNDLPINHALFKHCKESKRKRALYRYLRVVRDEEILDLREVVREGEFIAMDPGENKFVFSFVANENITIKDVYIFSPLDLEVEDFAAKDVMRHLERKEHQHRNIIRNKWKLRLISDYGPSKDRVFLANQRHSLRLNKWITFTTNLFVPKNSRISLEVVLREEQFMRHVVAEPYRIFESSGAETKKIFDNINLEHFHKEDGPTTNEFKTVTNEAFTVFKGLRYKLN
ncbi:uncharacterized protein LOC135942519 [Cloeon dipterum]|uniref:uncharacterized protein LOC135942519 n=1 Tax=Cloeon dipterum TaxID=197152 RepID=UPI00321FD94A